MRTQDDKNFMVFPTFSILGDYQIAYNIKSNFNIVSFMPEKETDSLLDDKRDDEEDEIAEVDSS